MPSLHIYVGGPKHGMFERKRRDVSDPTPYRWFAQVEKQIPLGDAPNGFSSVAKVVAEVHFFEAYELLSNDHHKGLFRRWFQDCESVLAFADQVQEYWYDYENKQLEEKRAEEELVRKSNAAVQAFLSK